MIPVPKILSERGFLFPALVLLLLAFLLFFRLGHYALWSDEAETALHAQGILATGDTTARIGHNLVAYDGGINLRHFCERMEPPLQSYLAAPFLALFGAEAGAVRLPFAAFGLALAVLSWRAMVRRGVPPFAQALSAAAILGNVSLLLYFRQCRYYAPTLFFSTLLAYLWLTRKGDDSPWRKALLPLCAVLLFASNPMNAAALFLCLGIDWLCWHRKTAPIPPRDLLRLFLPAAVGIVLVALVWNPLATLHGAEAARRNRAGFLEHFGTLFLWNWRDMNRCEFFSGLLFLAALPVGLWLRDRLLLRGARAALLYTAFISAVSPQDLWGSQVADIRYLVPLIPLFLLLEVTLLYRVGTWNRPAAIVLALLAFGTNLFNLLVPQGNLPSESFHSTPALYAEELLSPPDDPYTLASRWINENVPPEASVWALPNYAAYPLMFHAPHAIYAWQVEDPPKNPELRDLPPIHYLGRIPPDYIVALGPTIVSLRQILAAWQSQGLQYRPVGQILFPGHDAHRPELFWRTFRQPQSLDPEQDGIYFFQRVN